MWACLQNTEEKLEGWSQASVVLVQQRVSHRVVGFNGYLYISRSRSI